MNGEDFYDHFKHALAALGLSWSEKGEMRVRAEKDRVVFGHGRNEFVVITGEQHELHAAGRGPD